MKYLLLVTILLSLCAIGPNPPAATAQAGRGGDFHIRFGNVNFDPLVDGEPAVVNSGPVLTADGEGLWLLQLNRTIDDAEMAALSADVTFIQYIPHHTYLVWASAAAVDNLAARNPLVRWVGAYHPDYRIAPKLAAERTRTANAVPLELSATFVGDGELPQLQQLVTSASGTLGTPAKFPVMGAARMAKLDLTLPNDRIDALLRLPTLYHVEATLQPRAADESAALIVADRLDETNGPNIFVEYWDWLFQTGYLGEGVTVAIVDSGVDWDHSDFDGRVVSGTEYGGYQEAGEPGSDGAGSSAGHGTHVAGIVAGSGFSGPADVELMFYGLGIAPRAWLHAMDFLGDGSSDRLTAFRDAAANADLSNNSWGGTNTAGDGYTQSTADHDAVVLESDGDTEAPASPFLAIFAAGNDGSGGATTIGVPKEAKNIITVGNGLSDRSDQSGGTSGNISALSSDSSRGPAVDGRIKPDLYAPGTNIISARNADGVNVNCTSTIDNPPGGSTVHSWCSGTSMAAPQVTGVAALFTEFWRDYTDDDDRNPDPALVKAALLATTDTQPGVPSFDFGWGRLNADRLLNPPVPILYYENPEALKSNDDAWTLDVVPYDTTEPLRIALVWSDAPGAPTASPALVNDLDLIVTPPGGGPDDYWGNDFGPGGWSQLGTDFDELNNVEMVWVENPSAGLYEITVNVFALNGDAILYDADLTDQHFSLVCYNCLEDFYVDDSVDDGLVAYWKFDEGSGDDYHDLSGNDNHAREGLQWNNDWDTDTAAAIRFANPQSLFMDGDREYAFAADDHTLDPGFNLTVAAWVKLDSTSGARTVVDKVVQGTPNSGYSLRVLDGSLQSIVYDANGTTHAIQGGAVPSGVWTHVAFTYTAAGYLANYVNGAGTGIFPVSGYGVASNSSGVYIGAPAWDQSVNELAGHVDEVRIYNRALTPLEIERLGQGYDCETTGASWAEAHHFLQCAFTNLNNWTQLDTVHVAEGVYTPGLPRTSTFTPPPNSVILGGYLDGGGQRDWHRFKTILSGDLYNDDTARDISGSNAYVVVDVNNPTTLSGVVIEGGNADADPPFWVGAGVNAFHSGLLTIEDSILRNNHADFGGGALFRQGGTTHIVRTLFAGNEGGDIQIQFGEDAEVRDSVFAGTLTGQGQIFEMDDVTFVGNTVVGRQNPFGFGAANSLTILNNIFWDNFGGGAQFTISGVTSPDVRHNIVQGGYSGAGNSGVDPRFADGKGPDNVYGTSDDNLRLHPYSPAVDSGSNEAGGCSGSGINGTARGFDGNGDTVNGCDKGAHEFGALLLVLDDRTDANFDNDKAVADAFDALGVPFERFDSRRLSTFLTATFYDGFNQIVWLTGRADFDFFETPIAGPSASAEAALGDWLDGPGVCFLISSQSYYYDYGLTFFMQDYLGVSDVDEFPQYDNVTGSGLFAGIGPATLTFPLGFSNRTDHLSPDGTATTAFTTGSGTTGVHKATAAYRSAYFGFPLERLERQAVETTLQSFLDDCAPHLVPTAITVSAAQADVGTTAATTATVALLVFLVTTIVISASFRRIVRRPPD